MDENGRTVHDAERSISCSFCKEKFTKNDMREHLLMCGNKTDECPKCRKYIRRAVFAYHFENECADVSMFDNDGQPRVSTRTTNSSYSTTSPGRHRTELKVDLSRSPDRDSSIRQAPYSSRL